MTAPQKIHPHDVGLPEPAIRKRRKSRRFARIMLTIAVITALAGWPLLGQSVVSAIRMRTQNPYQAIIAWAILIVSSVTLVLGLWYLLLAQVERVARIVEADETLDPSQRLCPNCGWFFDPPDRYCRHCGKPLGMTIAPPTPSGR
ncbi:MAG TPA: zinc ribbon domain-containing protein [Phycisphaerae bacterium]|nr:zinc ribbon domain-containing protein [Phycisphaerae bacterium]